MRRVHPSRPSPGRSVRLKAAGEAPAGGSGTLGIGLLFRDGHQDLVRVALGICVGTDRVTTGACSLHTGSVCLRLAGQG